MKVDGDVRERGPRVNNDLGSIKIKIHSFHEKNVLEAYSELVTKIEMVFECHNYSEVKKVKLTVVEFTDYVIIWWDQLLFNRGAIENHEMKGLMRKRFVSNHY